MLLCLDIKNAALIEHLSIEIKKGMTVLTGETGAGKSVIIDSVNMIMGARTSKSIVRYGEDKAYVQAMFSTEDSSFSDKFGIPCDDGTVVILREVSSDGKSVCRINGMIEPQNVVKEVTQGLITIHGQHDSQALLTASRHIDFLDSYADNKQLLSEYAEVYGKRKSLMAELASLEADEAEKMRRIDLLSYQVDEIEKARLRVGEKEELSAERIIIQNGEKLSESLGGAYENLYNAENSAYDAISTAASLLSGISDIDDKFSEIHQRAVDMQYEAEELSHDIYALASSVEYDEQALNDIEERLDTITKLERKYGGSEERVLDYFEKAKKELSRITDSDAEKMRLSEELNKLEKELKSLADKLCKKRREYGKKLGEAIEKELAELDMPRATFTVSVEDTGEFAANGTNRVEFLISPNKGEPEKPLEKIASGGELSRVMLAIKTILADTDNVDTLIFDEIDTGVSGGAAKKIAAKLHALSEKKQVICVSHQPQLAAAADNHFKIKKTENGERTVTTADELDSEQRIEEIARIIDGDNITDASRTHAREMLMQYGGKNA